MYTWYNKQRPDMPLIHVPKPNPFENPKVEAEFRNHLAHLTGVDPQHSPGTPMTYNTPRARILNEAMEIVHKDRNANYGSPEDNFKQIAELWSAYKKVPFTPADVAIMNALIKIARLSKTPTHHDSAVDLAGYAACLGDIQASMKGDKPKDSSIETMLRNVFPNRSV